MKKGPYAPRFVVADAETVLRCEPYRGDLLSLVIQLTLGQHIYFRYQAAFISV
jgi:hypothetical protein